MAKKLININKIPKDKTTYTRPAGAGNFDNMDDKNIVDQINIKIGTHDLAPTLNKHIVNKEYADALISGATGSFTAASGENVTVVNGLVTSINIDTFLILLETGDVILMENSDRMENG